MLPMQYADSMMAFMVIRLVCPAVTEVTHPRLSTKPAVPAVITVSVVVSIQAVIEGTHQPRLSNN